MTPNFLTHYYLPDSKPFLSISELSETEWAILCENFKERLDSDDTYNRRFGLGYQGVRWEVENELREKFITKGGQPTRKYPYYLCLGECDWWKHFCQHDEVIIPIKDIDPKTISFTYPDSFTSLGFLARFGIKHEVKPYHGEVFTLQEMRNIVNKFGMPRNQHKINYKSYHKEELELYVEAQLWSETPAANIIKYGN